MTAVTLTALLDAVLDAAWVVDVATLHILATNAAAAQLVDMAPQALVGMPIIEFSATPEDLYFWEDAAEGIADAIHSDSMVRSASGVAVPVERKVSKVRLQDQAPVFLVCMQDRRAHRQVEQALEQNLTEMRAALESSADGILVTDAAGDVRHCNRPFTQLWSVPAPVLQEGEALRAHLHHQVQDAASYALGMERLAQDPHYQGRDLIVLRSGRVLERSVQPHISQGRVLGRVYSFRDVTEREQAQAEQSLAASVFASSLDAIFITDAQLTILQVNPRCEALCAKPRQHLVGSPATALFSDDRDAALLDSIRTELLQQGVWSATLLRSSAARGRTIELSWVAERNAHGELAHTIGFVKDVSAYQEASQRIDTLVYTDTITGLPNRLLLSERVGRDLVQPERRTQPFGVLAINLDHFKRVNDSLGHAHGDRALTEVAQRVVRAVGEHDLVSRTSGDTFVAYLPDADVFAAESAARRVLGAMAPAFQIDGTPFSLSCSIGVAMYPQDASSLDGLIRCAETAMYRVKDRGRGNLRFYQPQMNVNLLARLKLDHAIRRALEQRQFRLHYQPQVALADARLLGVEALLRWDDAELGAVSPATFIPLAEESGFIIQLGSWVLHEAVRQAAEWVQAGTPLVVSVNVSALQFQQSDFVHSVGAALEAAALAPEWLELELTESILLQDAAEALARLHALAALGVKLAIDDFGTGYSSLAYLKKIPLSKLKIDRSFIQGLPEDEGDRAIVSATLAMAHGLQLSVVAEGVETWAQHDCLHALQCQAYQGFLFSHAIPASAVERLLRPVTLPSVASPQVQ